MSNTTREDPIEDKKKLKTILGVQLDGKADSLVYVEGVECQEQKHNIFFFWNNEMSINYG